MTHGFEELNEARELLHTTRTAARKAARDLEIELTRAAQSAVDEAAYSAVSHGATKTSVAAYLGESRTTLNQRLARAGGQVHDPAVEVVVPQAQPSPITATNSEPAYTFHDGYDGPDMLEVGWVDYGPEHLTGHGRMEIVADPDSGEYWFMTAPGETHVDITERLDTMFSGWYYDDAVAFVKNALKDTEE